MNGLPTFSMSLDCSTCAVIGREIARHLTGAGLSFDTSPIEDGYLNPQSAADYLGVSRKRVHDLTSMGALIPDGRDGRTPLYTRATLDNYVSGALTRR